MTISVAKLFAGLSDGFKYLHLTFFYVFSRPRQLILPFMSPEPGLTPRNFYDRTNDDLVSSGENLDAFADV